MKFCCGIYVLIVDCVYWLLGSMLSLFVLVNSVVYCVTFVLLEL